MAALTKRAARWPHQPPVHHRHSLSHRSAFTLLELLVVMGIIMVFAGLGLTAILRLPSINKLASAEQAIAGALRQARHTAKATGNPVVLELGTVAKASGATDEAVIRGTVASVLWSERFEGDQDPDLTNARPVNPLDFPFPFPVAASSSPDDIAAAKAKLRSPAGLSGHGYHLQIDHNVDTLAKVATITLDRERALIDDGTATGKRRDGVLVRVACRFGGAAGMQPLILITPQDERDSRTGTLPNGDEAAIGLAAIRRTRYLYPYDTRPTDPTDARFAPQGVTGTAPTPIAFNPSFDSWEIVGWSGDGAGGYDALSNWEDSVTGLRSTDKNLPDWQEFNQRVATCDSERWHDIQFLVTAQRLTMIIDGAVVADKTISRKIWPPKPAVVYLGMAHLDHVPWNLTIPVDARLDPNVTLDDVRILRLAGGVAGKLPPAITLDGGPFQLLCLPDGRIVGTNNTLNDAGAVATSNNQITLRGSFDEKNDKAVITVQADGSLASELIPAAR